MVDFDNMPPSRQPEGTFPWMMQQPPRPLYPGDRPVTAKENYLRVLRGETPYWMPIWLTDSQYCWPDVMQEHALWEGDGPDWWGQEWVFEPMSKGQMPKPGTRTIYDITNWRNEVKIPDLDAVDWDSDAKIQKMRYDPDRCHLFHCVEGIFERLHELMPMDETLLAMYEEPEAVKDFFDMMVDYKIKICSIVFEKYAPIDYIIWGDDWGTQKAGFFSNDMYREFIMPYTKRVWDYVHSTGRYIELHSCGLTQQYIEEFVEMGLDAWTPQPINDLDMLTEKYGDKISLTVNIPGLETAKTEAEVRKAVKEFVDKYAPRGHRVVANGISALASDEKLMKAAMEELYYDSSEYYAKVRAAEGK